MFAKSLIHYHIRQLRQSPATGIFLTSGWVAAVLLTFISGQLIAANRADLNALFAYLPWVMAVLIPTLTMPVASEGRRGVAERLLTLPHTPAQRIFSRFAVLWALLGIWILGLTPLVATLYYLGSPDFGPIATGLFGSWLLAAPMLAISLALCLQARSGVSGLLASLAACFFLLLIGTNTVTGWFAAVPGLGWLPSTAHLTLLGAYQPFTQGLLNLSATLLLIALTLLILGTLLTNPIHKFRSAMPALAGILLAIIALIPTLNWVQLDATAESLHTPSPATIETLRSLKSPVTFTLHLSQNNPDVPPAVHTYTHSLTNLLLRLRAEAPANVTVKISNSDDSTAAAITALQAGATEQSLPTGTTYFAALTAQINSTTTVIPILNPARVAAQEYDIMALLSHALRTTQPHVTILENPQNPTPPNNTVWQTALRENFTLSTISTASGVTEITSDTNVLLMPDDAALSTQTLQAIRTYLNHGGNVVLMADTFTRTNQPQTLPNETRLSSILPEWGLQLVSNSVVADPSAATMASQSGAGATAYPYWLQLGASNLGGNLPFTTGINKLFFPESGAFTTLKTSNPLILTPFITTSPQARSVPLETFQSTPAELANTNLPAASGPQILAVMVAGAFSQDADKAGQLIAFADTDWLATSSLQQAPDNLTLLTGTLHYLTGQGALTQLRAKGASPRTLTRIEDMANRLTRATTITEQKIATRLYEVTQKQGADPYASAEAIQQMQEEEFTLRQQLRDIRATSRHRLQSMENALLLINLALMPTIVGILFFLQRRRQRLKATSTL